MGTHYYSHLTHISIFHSSKDEEHDLKNQLVNSCSKLYQYLFLSPKLICNEVIKIFKPHPLKAEILLSNTILCYYSKQKLKASFLFHVA